MKDKKCSAPFASFIRRLFPTILTLSLLVSLSAPVFAAAEPYSVKKAESEPNDSFLTADIINQDDTIYGTIKSASDVDHYKVTFTLAGSVNFFLGNIPSGKNYDLYIYDSSKKLVKSSTGTGSYEMITNYSVSKGSTYYMVVKSASGYSTTSEYQLRCKLSLSPYYAYGNKNASTGCDSWSDTNVNKCYNGSYNWDTVLKDAGCMVGAFSTVLKNLGVTSTASYTDIRDGSYGKLQPDPFTVMWANTNFAPYQTDSSGKYKFTYNENPIMCYRDKITSGFGCSVKSYVVKEQSDTVKMNTIAYYLTLHPEGIIVNFQKPGYTHSIVVTGTTYEAPTDPVIVQSILNIPAAENDDPYEFYTPDCCNNSPQIDFPVTTMRASTYDSMLTVSDPCNTGSWNSYPQLLTSSSCYSNGRYSVSDIISIFVISKN